MERQSSRSWDNNYAASEDKLSQSEIGTSQSKIGSQSNIGSQSKIGTWDIKHWDVDRWSIAVRLIGAIIVGAFFVPQLVDVLRDKSNAQGLNDLFLMGKAAGTLIVIVGLLMQGGMDRHTNWKHKNWIIIVLFLWTIINYVVYYAVKHS